MDERLQRGILEFNQERFFEAHEVWEDLWHGYRETDRTFLQGLINLAASFYHCQCGNEKGTVSQANKAIEKLQAYAPQHNGIQLVPLLSRAEEIALEMQKPQFRIEGFPKIEYHDIQLTHT